jgi:MFS family permease
MIARTVLSVLPLLAATALLLVGFGLGGTLLGLRAAYEGYADPTIGAIMSAYFLGYVLGSRVMPALVMRVGHVRAFSGMAALTCGCTLLHGMVVNPAAWWFLRFATGICMLGLYLVIESWMNHVVSRDNRGGVFAVYMTVVLLSLGAGQFLIMVYGVETVAPFALAAVFLALAVVPMTLTPTADPTLPVTAPVSLRDLFAFSRLAMIGIFITGLGNGAFWGMGAVFIHGIGGSNALAAGFMASVIIGGAVLQWPIGRLSDQHDRRTVLALTSIAASLTAVVLYLVVSDQVDFALALAAFYGGCSFAMYSLCVAHANDHVEPDRMLDMARGLLLANGIGAALGPLLAGGLMHAFGPRTLMAYLAATTALAALYTLYRMQVRAPVPVTEQTVFLPMARTSAAATQLDPRTEPAAGDSPVAQRRT